MKPCVCSSRTEPETLSPLPQAQGVLKDISVELLQHLDQGTAFIQVSTKLNPRGEIRGQVRTDEIPLLMILCFFQKFKGPMCKVY